MTICLRNVTRGNIGDIDQAGDICMQFDQLRHVLGKYTYTRDRNKYGQIIYYQIDWKTHKGM